MEIRKNLRRITELGIGFIAVVTLGMTGCGGGGDDGNSPAATVLVSTISSTAGTSPTYIASDGTYVYVTDFPRNNILKININTGVASVLAGDVNGTSGSTDNISGTSARFNSPWGITIDANNLYIADKNSHTIRQIGLSASAAVSTLAGAASAPGSTDANGTSARFKYPAGITRINTSLYVTDSSNCTIRKIDLSASAAVSTLAGNGICGYTNGASAVSQFYGPTGITTDGASFVYVADTVNNNVRRVDVSTGETTLVAGGNFTLPQSGAGSTDGTHLNARFNWPFGIATDGTNLYVTDSRNHTIRKIVIATGIVSTIAGIAGVSGSTDGTGPNARFNYPIGLIYENGALYVADTTNGRIRKIGL